MSDGDAWRERAIRDAVLAGDAAAWRAWYDAHFDRLAAYVRWRCGGLPTSPTTWSKRRGSPRSAGCGVRPGQGPVLRVAVRDRVERRPQRDPRPPPAEDAAPLAWCRATTSRGRHRRGEEKAERVAAALAALPDHYEAVLRAKYLDRLSVDEIAASRGESPKAVESLLLARRQAFREAYEKHR